MKAVIFNSGRGIRMGDMTSDRPKCMVELNDGETVFERQIRILRNCGIREFVITTGPYPEQLKAVAARYRDLSFTFVNNPEYESTNYIVSMYYARKEITDDVLLLHGDLVFNESLICKMLGDERASLCLYHQTKELPDKDFKGRFENGFLREVSVCIFDKDCYAFQPLYKLSKSDVAKWLSAVEDFVENGDLGVYAENALNSILDTLRIPGMSYHEDYIEEIDNQEDYIRVLAEISEWDKKGQQIIISDSPDRTIRELLPVKQPVFIVCSKRERARTNPLPKDRQVTFFHDFSPNPKYEEIMEGVKQYETSGAKMIVAIGGGSAIDVAKCIKLFQNTSEADFLQHHFVTHPDRLIALPTTAGTGSESTAIAVIYYKGEKHSVAHASILPDTAVLAAQLLQGLPAYHVKSSLADAFCQAVESFWSRGANAESRFYASECIGLILRYRNAYLQHGEDADSILLAANFSGKAIHISRTTAAHAMSYKLTTKYGISHGHAVAVCMAGCWRKLLDYAQYDKNLYERLRLLACVMGYEDIVSAYQWYQMFLKELELPEVKIQERDYAELVSSVNVERLGNNPVPFTKDDLYDIYCNINSLS